MREQRKEIFVEIDEPEAIRIEMKKAT